MREFWKQPVEQPKGDKLDADKIEYSLNKTDHPLEAFTKSEGGGGLSALVTQPGKCLGKG